MSHDLLERLAAPADEATRSKLQAIPFPAVLAPKFEDPASFKPNDPLPKVDVVVSTYTAAEGQALADVLSPGLELQSWTKYEHNFSEFEPDLTWKSPAKESHCLGQYAVVTIGSKKVLLFRNELHLATDSIALPLRKCWAQMIEETGCSLWIDTGTAGGIGPEVVEGDAVAGNNLVFDCTGEFKGEAWAHQSFAGTFDVSSIDFSEAETLMAVNADLLKPEASRDPKVWHADVITCDSFLFDDAEDSFGLQKYDGGAALVEEMDCAVLGLVAGDVGESMPKFTSLRSVSDPQMPDLGSVEKEKAAAGTIYTKFGYAAQVACLCAVWQVIVGS